MKTVKVNLFTFSELSEEVRSNLIEANRDRVANYLAEFDGDDRRKTLERFEYYFDVKVNDWCVGYPGTYFRFNLMDSNWDHSDFDLRELSGLRLYKYLQNNYMKYLETKKTYYHNEKKRTSRILPSQNTCLLTGVYCDKDILQPIYDYLKKPDLHLTFYGLIKRCLGLFFSRWENEMESYYNDDIVLKELEDNLFCGTMHLQDGTVFDVAASN